MLTPRRGCEVFLNGTDQEQQAGTLGHRLLVRSPSSTWLLRAVRLAVTLSFLSLPLAMLAGGAVSLSAYLRLDGTQLDLRGANITDEDLAGLNDPAFSKVISVLLSRTKVGDCGLQYLRNLHVRELDLYLTAVTDKGLGYLHDLPIERLNLTGTDTSDSGLAHLRNLPLAVLVLRETKVTSTGLGVLRDLPLQYLDLSHTAITDDGLVHVKCLRELKTIDLSDTAITDQGLRDLIGIPSLTNVYVAGTRVSTAGLARFKAARPEVRVYAERPVR